MNRRFLFITLILFVMTVNMCRGMVLCIGGNGRVVLEIAGHKHCKSEGHKHEAERDKPDMDASSYGDAECCEPCVDVPLSICISEDRGSSKKLKVKAPIVIADFKLLDTLQNEIAESMAMGVHAYISPYELSLRSVVLLV